MLEAWHNENDAPLMRQWEELRDRGAPAITPITQETLWRMRQELAAIERAKPQPPRDEMLLAAKAEFRDSCHRHRAAVTAIVESQQRLQRYQSDPIYTLLFNMREILQPPTPTQAVLDNRCSSLKPDKAYENAQSWHVVKFRDTES
jgi:hypothetical protein